MRAYLARPVLRCKLGWWAALAFTIGYEIVGRPGVQLRWPLPI